MATEPKAPSDLGPDQAGDQSTIEPQLSGQSGDYEHADQAVQRPAMGVQEDFPDRRPPKDYRYDASLAPELCWDENAERTFAEWLLDLIERGALEGEAAVFAQAPAWVGTGERFRSIPECVARLRSLTQPFLNWSGKAERQQIRVPTIPLFVHERQSTQAILSTLESYKAIGTVGDLFGDPKLDVSDQLDAYDHSGPWSNRLVLGDSLQVMNSLLEYEGLGGQVQMIYMDPPYGVKFGSNFQPFVRKRDVKHGQDEDMIREPEMVKAYRDTWELGLHSYLTVIRDRLLLAKELLTESGSIFVQISDENLHHVREVMDEVFPNGFVSQISFQTTSGFDSSTLPTLGDFLLWYAKDKARLKYNRIFQPQPLELGKGNAKWVLLPDGSYRGVTAAEVRGDLDLPKDARAYNPDNLQSQGAASEPQPFVFEGKTYKPGANSHWKPNYPKGLSRLAAAGRIHVAKSSIRYRRFADDFPYQQIGNIWTDTLTGSFTDDKLYVVQTGIKVSERCMLMTTDPGDLVFDPTCGSGTTAYVAEQWGRRWITCDTSRVPIALARQRLLTATFPWYALKEPSRGPAGGFVYQRKQNKKGEEVGGLVPRITLKSIANDEEPETVTLVDRPEVNTKITRVCGRFTVESTVQAARSVDDPSDPVGRVSPTGRNPTPAVQDAGLRDAHASYENPRRYLDRMIEVLRKSHTLRLPGNVSLSLAKVRALSGEQHEYLHAEAVEHTGNANEGGARIAVVFGPEDGAIDSQQVFDAAREAYFLKFDALYLFGFAIQAKARELVSDRKKLRLPCVYVAVTPDVVMSDLLKTSASSEVFSVTGLPDVRVERTGETAPSGDPLYRVKLLGLDIFRPHDLETEAIAADDLPCWMLDPDYNGMVFMARQVFFPKTSAWDNLERSLRGRFAEGLWAHLAGTESEPFAAGIHRQIAVKVIDERGNELMVVKCLND